MFSRELSDFLFLVLIKKTSYFEISRILKNADLKTHQEGRKVLALQGDIEHNPMGRTVDALLYTSYICYPRHTIPVN